MNLPTKMTQRHKPLEIVMHLPPEVTQRRETFAAYLKEMLTTRPAQFDYGRFLCDARDSVWNVLDDAKRMTVVRRLAAHECGTVGCVAGHYMACFYANSYQAAYHYSGALSLMREELLLTRVEAKWLTEPIGMCEVYGDIMTPELARDIVNAFTAFFSGTTKLHKHWLIELCVKHKIAREDYLQETCG